MTIKNIEIIRTEGSNTDFRAMVKALDMDLYARNGDVQAQYEKYNGIDKIKNAIVVYLAGIPVGCGCFKQFEVDTIEIKRMFVQPDKRGLGLGSIILNELEAWAIEVGYKKAVLETGVRQIEAQRLYCNSSYVLTENYGQYIGMEDSICYMKELI